MLTLLLGPSGSGKTLRICEDIRGHMADRRGMVLLTPEQQSHRMERLLSAVCGPALSLHGEVLSFTRMYSRAAVTLGGLADRLPDRGSRLLLMALAQETVEPRLRRYGGRGRKADFLQTLCATAEELQGAMLTPQALLEASEKASGAMRDKLWDMALLLEAYEAVTEQLLGDRRDAVARLADGIADCDVGSGGVWADGFTDFTPRELQVLDGLLRRGTDLTVALTLPEGEEGHYAIPEATFRDLLALAERRGTETEICRLPAPPEDDIRALGKRLYAYHAAPLKAPGGQVELICMESFAGECRAAAGRIRELMMADPSLRYSDFAVAAADFPRQRGMLAAVFREYGIPVFVEETEPFAPTGLAVFVTEALETVTGAFRARDLFRCLRTGFGPLTGPETDELENYVLTWDLRGESTWAKEEDWDLSPGGYGGGKDSDPETLRRLNGLRRRAAAPFLRLARALKEPGEARALLAALGTFLEDCGVRETLARRAEKADEGERARLAAQWRALTECLGQASQVLGEMRLSGEELARLLELLFRSREMGAIPAALDCVSLGSPQRLRGAKMRVLFILGADDGHLPAQLSETGLFSLREKRDLLALGIPLGREKEEELTRPLLDLCLLASAPREKLIVSWSGGEEARPSLLAERAGTLLGVPVETERALAGRYLAAPGPMSLCLALSRGPWAEAARAALEPGVLERLERRAAQTRQPLRPETVEKLYGNSLHLTPSRAETFHQCSYLYFLQYGLRARERKTASFAAPESGTFIHYLLENVCREVRSEGGFRQVSEERLRALTRQYTEAFAGETFRPAQLRDSRFGYLFRRLCRTAEAIVLDVAGELAAGEFQPLDFELSFSAGGDLPPARVGDIWVQGTVDRVDGWVDGDRLYLCVADYKTGKKKFSLTDVRYGMGIQMLIYLFLLSDEGAGRYGMPVIPAGVLYAPAREVLLSMPRSSSPEEIARKRADTLRRSGLLLNDRRLLQAREMGEDPRYIPVSYRDGVPAGSLATAAQLGDLAVYVKKLLVRMGSELRGGKAEASPLYKNKVEGPCRWCPYGSVCAFDEKREPLRMEHALRDGEFWDEIREEGEHG